MVGRVEPHATIAAMADAELIEAIREEQRLTREEQRLTRAAIFELRDANRELLLDMRENRGLLRELAEAIHAQTQGLLHVLDELRGSA